MAETLDPAFEELLRFVKEERGFDFTGYKRPASTAALATEALVRHAGFEAAPTAQVVVDREGNVVCARDVEWQLPSGEVRDVDVVPLVSAAEGAVGVTVTDVTRYRLLQQALDASKREAEAAYEELQSEIGLPVERLRKPIKACLETSDRQATEMEAVNRFGRTFTCRVAVTALHGLDGAPTGAIVFMEPAEGA